MYGRILNSHRLTMYPQGFLTKVLVISYQSISGVVLAATLFFINNKDLHLY